MVGISKIAYDLLSFFNPHIFSGYKCIFLNFLMHILPVLYCIKCMLIQEFFRTWPYETWIYGYFTTSCSSASGHRRVLFFPRRRELWGARKICLPSVIFSKHTFGSRLLIRPLTRYTSYTYNHYLGRGTYNVVILFIQRTQYDLI